MKENKQNKAVQDAINNTVELEISEAEYQSLIKWAESGQTEEELINIGPLTEEDLAIFEMSDAEYEKFMASLDADLKKDAIEPYEGDAANTAEAASVDFIGTDVNLDLGF